MKKNIKYLRLISFIIIFTIFCGVFNTFAISELSQNSDFIYENSNKYELTLDSIPEKLISDMDLYSKNAIGLSVNASCDLSSFETINKDGTNSLYMFGEPIKYIENETGEIKFIDNSIISEKSNSKTAFKNASNSYKVNFPKNILDGITLENDGYFFKMTPVNTLINIKETQVTKKDIGFKNNKQEYIEYTDIFGKGINLQYELLNSGLKESICLDKYDGNSVYQFEIEVNDLIPSAFKGTQIEFLNKNTNERVFTVEPIFIEDSYTGEYIEGEEHITYSNYYTVVQSDKNKYLLSMILDKEFLENPNTVYPVLIDPSISSFTEQRFLTNSYVAQSGGIAQTNTHNLTVGLVSNNNEHISYVKTTNLSEKKWINPNSIIYANFHVKDSSLISTTYTIDCFDSNTTENVSNINYSYILTNIGNKQSSTTFSEISNEYEFDITNLTKQWINYELGQGGKSANYGFILRGASTQTYKYKNFTAARNTTDTYISISYTESSINSSIYYIKNKSNNQYLKFNSGGTLTTSATKDTSTRWKVTIQDDDSYYIRPESNLSYGLNWNTLSALGANIAIPGKTWRIIKNNDNNYRIMPMVGNAVYYAFGFSGSATLQDYNNNSYQNWEFEISNTNVLEPSTINTKEIIMPTDTETFYTSENYYMQSGQTGYIKFKPARTGQYSIYTKYYENNKVDTKIDVSLHSNFANSTSNDNTNDNNTNYNACVTFNANANQLYYIRISGGNDANISKTGFYTLVIHRGFPTSGDEKTDMKNIYNSSAMINKNNCYTFALGLFRDPVAKDVWGNKNPGNLGGVNYNYNSPFEILTDKTKFQNVIEGKNGYYGALNYDFNYLGNNCDWKISSATAQPEIGYYKIALFLDPFYPDFHWYRQLPDGSWAHKRSYLEVSDVDSSNNKIFDPENCSRRYSTQFGTLSYGFISYYEIKIS